MIYEPKEIEWVRYAVAYKMIYTTHYFNTGLEVKFLACRRIHRRLLPRVPESVPKRRAHRFHRGDGSGADSLESARRIGDLPRSSEKNHGGR